MEKINQTEPNLKNKAQTNPPSNTGNLPQTIAEPSAEDGSKEARHNGYQSYHRHVKLGKILRQIECEVV